MDCGFSTTSRVDNVTVPGMSIPTRLQACTEYDYLPPRGETLDEEEDAGLTFDDVVVNMMQDTMQISDIISLLNREEFVHYDNERNKTWATRVAADRGASEKHLRSDNGSVMITGRMSDFTTRTVRMHRDIQNDTRPQASDVIGLCIFVPVTYQQTGETVDV